MCAGGIGASSSHRKVKPRKRRRRRNERFRVVVCTAQVIIVFVSASVCCCWCHGPPSVLLGIVYHFTGFLLLLPCVSGDTVDGLPSARERIGLKGVSYTATNVVFFPPAFRAVGQEWARDDDDDGKRAVVVSSVPSSSLLLLLLLFLSTFVIIFHAAARVRLLSFCLFPPFLCCRHCALFPPPLYNSPFRLMTSHLPTFLFIYSVLF